MAQTAADSTPRVAYHHGNLRSALVAAGLELTRAGGPDALVLREVTRRVGVSPNAAYRHFADRQALLRAVGARLQEELATRMRPAESHLTSATALRAVGLAYIDFALTEPGWFALAFADVRAGPDLGSDTDGPAPPFRMLTRALDGLVAEGLLDADHRAGAEWPCWAAVHGFAELALHGPLHDLPPAEVRRAAERTVEAIIAGLLAGAGTAETRSHH